MISIVMPAHNEQGYLEPAVKAVVAAGRDRNVPFEVVIAENGSTDSTVAEAEGLAETFAEVRVLTYARRRLRTGVEVGLPGGRRRRGRQFRRGFRRSRISDDAVELIASGPADIVVGSKRIPGSDDQRRVGRRVVTAVFSVLLRYGFGLHVSDTHGVKAYAARQLLTLVRGLSVWRRHLRHRVEPAPSGTA